MDWRDRLLARMRALEMTQADLVRRAGLKHQSHLNRILKGVDPSLSVASRIAKAIGWDLTELHEGDVYSSPKISLSGHIRGGDMWTETPRTAARTIPLDLLAKDLIAVEMTTNDWAPRYTSGDIVCGIKSASTNLHNLIGRDCIIETADGERMVKYIARSSVKGRYTLRSFLPLHEDIIDAKLAWAAPIEFVIRASAAN